MTSDTTHRYEAICEASPDAIVLVDAEGEITYANARVSDLFGYEPSALVGDPIERLVPESKREGHVEKRDAYLADPETRPMGANLELFGQASDGSTIPVDVSLSPLAHGDGVEVMAAIRDRRERTALRRKYQTILEAVPDAVVIAEAESAEIVEANDQVRALWGYDPDELVGWTQPRLHPSGEEARYRALFERHVADRQAMYTQFPDGSDVYIETAAGGHVPVEVNARVFTLGERTLVAEVFRDVSTRKERESQLRELNETTHQLMEADDSDAVARIAVDAAQAILGHESTVVRLVEDDRRLEPVAVTEQALTEMGVRPTYPLDGENPVSRAYDGGEPLAFDDVREVDDGYDRGEARAAMYLPMGAHGVISVVDSATDAFDQSDVELASILAANAETALDRLASARELRRQNARLEEFASIVAHDLRNPLTVARGWLSNAPDESRGDELDRVAAALDRMEEIIDDTLTLARQGRTVADDDVVDAAQVVGACWEMVATDESQLVLADEFRFSADRDRVQHVFENLFRNAIEHGGEGVTVTVGRTGSDGFYVADDGPGIPAPERDSVFETGYTNRPEGTGFGLTIVREIADAHGWTVTVTESESGGARFEFADVEMA